MTPAKYHVTKNLNLSRQCIYRAREVAMALSMEPDSPLASRALAEIEGSLEFAERFLREAAEAGEPDA